MARYIDADALIFKLRQNQMWTKSRDLTEAIITVQDQPTADVEEVKHGEWVHTDKAAHWHSKDECSECHYHTFHRIDLTHFNYCPNCGAKMDGERRDT